MLGPQRPGAAVPEDKGCRRGSRRAWQGPAAASAGTICRGPASTLRAVQCHDFGPTLVSPRLPLQHVPCCHDRSPDGAESHDGLAGRRSCAHACPSPGGGSCYPTAPVRSPPGGIEIAQRPPPGRSFLMQPRPFLGVLRTLDRDWLLGRHQHRRGPARAASRSGGRRTADAFFETSQETNQSRPSSRDGSLVGG
jgi:hypothetical protein